jgi:UPF0271 protein
MDINCDLGEGIGNDEKIMPYITSCNIACGGHAGDERSVTETIRLAKKYGVKPGAHPSFPDRENFGRIPLEISETELKKVLTDQILMIRKIAEKEGVKLHHLKPHGALYNLAVHDQKIAGIIIEVMQEAGNDLILYVPFNSLIEVLSRQYKIPYFYEVFADRAYRDDLSLVSRREQGALIEDPEIIYKRVKKMISEEKVVSNTGKEVVIKADTVCIHGDNPNAVEIARMLNNLI